MLAAASFGVIPELWGRLFTVGASRGPWKCAGKQWWLQYQEWKVRDIRDQSIYGLWCLSHGRPSMIGVSEAILDVTKNKQCSSCPPIAIGSTVYDDIVSEVFPSARYSVLTAGIAYKGAFSFVARFLSMNARPEQPLSIKAWVSV